MFLQPGLKRPLLLHVFLKRAERAQPRFEPGHILAFLLRIGLGGAPSLVQLRQTLFHVLQSRLNFFQLGLGRVTVAA